MGAGRSRRGGRAAPVVASYVRVAVGPGSLQRLRDEESHYRNINEAHRRHFEAMGPGSERGGPIARSQMLEGLAPYDCARPSHRSAACRTGRSLAPSRGDRSRAVMATQPCDANA